MFFRNSPRAEKNWLPVTPTLSFCLFDTILLSFTKSSKFSRLEDLHDDRFLSCDEFSEIFNWLFCSTLEVSCFSSSDDSQSIACDKEFLEENTYWLEYERMDHDFNSNHNTYHFNVHVRQYQLPFRSCFGRAYACFELFF